MKFDVEGAPVDPGPGDLIGNVYRCKGGNKTAYWVIAAVNVSTVICLGIDRDGNITSSSNYGVHVFDGFPWSRELLGRVSEMPDLNFRVVWNTLK